MPHDRDSLVDILESARRIIRYAAAHSRRSLESASETRDAVAYRFAVIGEAVLRVSDECRARHPELPWHEMKNMRHVLVHRYDSVNFDIVWDTIKQDLPGLVTSIETLLKEFPFD